MNETSLSLLGRACADPADGSWDRLVKLYSPLLKAWLCRMGVHGADADDLVQEILLAVSRDLHRFDHSGRIGAFRAWLRTMLLHRVRNFFRAQKYRPAAAGGSAWSEKIEQLADDSSSASREWNLEHDRHVMARLLESVRPRFEVKTWEAFRRQMFDGQRADQVAAELGMPLNSVYVARSRVLSTLRQEAAGLIDE